MWQYWGDLWAQGDRVHLDGPARTLTIHPEVSSISTTELYSAWVRWASLYDHLKYLPAMRTVGNDALPGGQVTGLFVFLMSGWQIVIDHAVTVDGIIYHDDPISPFVIRDGGGVTNKVAALAYGVSTSGVSGPTVSEIWSHGSRTLTTSIPTATQIRQEMDANSEQLADILAGALTNAGVAAAVIAALNGTAIPVNMVKVKGQTIQGSGTEESPWGQ